MHNFVKWVLQLFKVRYYDHVLYRIDFIRFLELFSIWNIPANENGLKWIKIFLMCTLNPWKWIEWIEMEWIRDDTSLIFEKKYSYLRITNFIPKTFIIIILKINYFIKVSKYQIGIKKRILNGIRIWDLWIMNLLHYPLHYFFNW